MIIEIHGCKSAIQKCLMHIEQLPNGFRPLYFSENETGVDKVSNRYSDTTRFEDFKSENPLGYFLHSESCMIDVSLDGDRSSVFLM